jgi:hypothetical protein
LPVSPSNLSANKRMNNSYNLDTDGCYFDISFKTGAKE